MEPKSRQEGMLQSPVLSLWLPWSYFSRLLRSCIGTVGLFLLPRPHRAQFIIAIIYKPLLANSHYIPYLFASININRNTQHLSTQDRNKFHSVKQLTTLDYKSLDTPG